MNKQHNDELKTCIMEKRVEKLESERYSYEVLKVILTPKMVIAISLGISFIIQVLKGA